MPTAAPAEAGRSQRPRTLAAHSALDQPRQLEHVERLPVAASPRREQQAAADRRHLDRGHTRFGRTLPDATNERRDEDRAGLEDATDQTYGEGTLQAGLADDRSDLLAQLARPALVKGAGDRVSVLREPGGLDREAGDLALAQRLRVDEARDGLDARCFEEGGSRVAERGLRSGGLTIAQRGLDRLDAEPVAGALVPEQMTPATRPPGAPVGADAEDV